MPAALPVFMAVFFCQTVAGHSGLTGTNGWKDLDWAINEQGLKVCSREYEYVTDLAAKEAQAQGVKIPDMHPDISKLDVCAKLGAYVPTTEDGETYAYKRGCPRPIYDDKTGEIVDYTDPPCPPDCSCSNESTDL